MIIIWISVPNKVMKPCDTPEGYRKSIDMVDKLLFYGLWSSNNCTCLRQCDQDIYITYTETTQMDKVYARLGKMRIYYQASFYSFWRSVISCLLYRINLTGFYLWRYWGRTGLFCYPIALRHWGLTWSASWCVGSDLLRNNRGHVGCTGSFHSSHRQLQ